MQLRRQKELQRATSQKEAAALQRDLQDVNEPYDRVAEVMVYKLNSRNKAELAKDEQLVPRNMLATLVADMTGYLYALDAAGFKPNNNQLALAGVIAYVFKRRILLQKVPHIRVMMQVPAGKGKSRIIAVVMCMLSNLQQFDRFTVVFNHAALLEDELPVLDAVKRVTGLHFECVLASDYAADRPIQGLGQVQGKKHCVILDEADCPLLDMLVPLEAPYVVGLTATAATDIDSIEAQYLLNTLGFHFFDANMVVDAELTQPVGCPTVADFLEGQSGAAKLIYADLTRSLQLELDTRELGYAHNETDTSKLRKMVPNTVLVVSDSALMRGFDYRALDPQVGISLLIAKPLSCQRTLQQAYGRVGRYGQPCRRFLLSGVVTPQHDMDTISAVLAAINAEKAAKAEQQEQARRLKR